MDDVGGHAISGCGCNGHTQPARPDILPILRLGPRLYLAVCETVPSIFRVGKANTLPMVPNDWSTLSNGTVDGRPTVYRLSTKTA